MDEKKLKDIQDRLQTGAYHGQAEDDLKFLVSVVEKLQKKNAVLSNHVSELTQEMENIRSDFGQNR